MDIDTIRRAYDAFARGDIPAVLAILDQDIVWVEPDGYPWGGTFRGHDEVLGLFETAGAALGESWRVEPDRLIGTDEGVVVVGRHTGARPAGEGWSVPFAMFFTMDGGTVVRFEQHGDSALMQRVVRDQAGTSSA